MALALVTTLGAPAWSQVKLNDCKTITDPGSYVVGKNITASGDCFVITTNLVTLDLGGPSGAGCNLVDNAF